MSDAIKRILGFILTVMLTSVLCITLYFQDNKYNEDGLKSIDGLLVVEEDSLETYPVSHLVTGWAFYPDSLLSPADFAEGNPDQYMFYTEVGEKARFDSTGDSTDPHGSGSYYLQLQLPEKQTTYALEIPEIYSTYKLYVGDRLILQMGNPERESYTPKTQTRMITFEASGSTSLLFAVSDYSHFYSGMVYPPAFGTSSGVDTTRGIRMGIALFVNTIGLLAALLSFYFGLRMRHKNAKLFSLLCLVMCVFTSYSLFHSILALPIFPWYALEMTSGYLLSLLLVVLHNRICDVDLYASRASTAVTAIVFLTTLCYGLFSAYLTVPVMHAFSGMVFCFKLVLSGYLLVTAYVSLCKNDNRQVAPLFYASIIYATTFAWDRIFPAYEPIWGGWFAEWGSLALVGGIGYTLWRDVTTAYENSILFSQEHRVMTRQLSVQMEYARQLQKSNDENRRLVHDFRHHLHTLEGIAAQFGEDNEMLHYLLENGTITASSAGYRNFCSNVAVNGLLQYYTALSEEKRIETDFQVQLPDNLVISNVELCTVIGNLLENAVESCLRQEESKRKIKISTNMVERTLFFVVENSSDGNYKLENGRFLSRKTKEARFGIGIESARHTVEQHGGSLDVFPESASFRVGITLKVR